MRRFMAVARHGSFSKAAELLDVPKSAVSSSVNRLEAHLNVRLLHRSTRSVTLTESGKDFLPECQRILADIAAVEAQFQDKTSQLTGDIVIDMPGRLYASLIAPRLSEWFAEHPKTRLRLIGADYRIDPIKESVDCVIRAGSLEDSELIAKPLGTFPMVNCVSPEYLKLHGTPTTLADLKHHYIVDYSPDMRPHAVTFDYMEDGMEYEINMRSIISVATTDAYLTSCLAGLGIIQVPLHGVNAQLERGELVRVLDNYTCPPLPLSIIYTSKRHMPKRVRAFIDWVESVTSCL